MFCCSSGLWTTVLCVLGPQCMLYAFHSFHPYWSDHINNYVIHKAHFSLRFILEVFSNITWSSIMRRTGHNARCLNTLHKETKHVQFKTSVIFILQASWQPRLWFSRIWRHVLFVDANWCFGGTCCLHHHSRRVKCWQICIKLKCHIPEDHNLDSFWHSLESHTADEIINRLPTDAEGGLVTLKIPCFHEVQSFLSWWHVSPNWLLPDFLVWISVSSHQYTILGLAISPFETTNVLHFKSVCFWYNENVLFL